MKASKQLVATPISIIKAPHCRHTNESLALCFSLARHVEQDAVCTEPLPDHPALLQQAVLCHLHRTGQAGIAKTLMEEAVKLNEPLQDETRQAEAVNLELYASLHRIVASLQSKDNSLAMEWMDRNKVHLTLMNAVSTLMNAE
jgi:hypothetical protein